MRSLGIVLVATLGLATVVGVARAFAQDATPVTEGGPVTLTVVERNINETITDLGEPGTSAGDLIVWGPNPQYDAANAVDTGSVSQGSCQILNAAGDSHCVETIVFPDGSTLALQGVELGDGAQSMRTIVGGSGQYLGAVGTMVVEATADRALWTKTLEIWT
jgi:hypothetical protein